MGMHLIYGGNKVEPGIVLQNVLTREFTQVPVCDPSNTDVWCWKYTIRVSAIVHKETAAVTSHPISTLDTYSSMGLKKVTTNQFIGSQDPAAMQMANLRESLMAYRKRFIFKIDDKTLLEAYPPDDPVFLPQGAAGFAVNGNNDKREVNNGPKPLECKITQITPSTFNIEYSIEVCKACEGTGNPTGVLGNRWSCVDDIDDTYKVTRTWNGRLRTVGGISPKTMAHQFRSLCLPPLLKGFRRKHMKFMGEPNGCELEYTITDEQVTGDMPPSPAAMIRGSHSESVGMAASAGIIGNVSLYVEGLPGATKDKLISLAMSIANHKLGIRAGVSDTHVVQQLRVTDYIGVHTNGIEVQMTVMHMPAGIDEAAQNTWGAAIIGRVGEPLTTLYGANYSTYTPNASAGVQLANEMFCYLQSPCESEHAISKFINGATSQTQSADSTLPGKTTSAATPQGTYQPTSALGPWAGQTGGLAFSAEAGRFPWQHSQVDVIDRTSSGKIALPKSQVSDGTSFAIIQVAAPTTIRVLRIAAERIGAHPTLPASGDITIAGKKLTYLDSKVNVRHPKLSGDGSKWIYGADAEVTYAVDMPWNESSVPIGKSPDTRENPNMRKFFQSFTAASQWMT